MIRARLSLSNRSLFPSVMIWNESCCCGEKHINIHTNKHSHKPVHLDVDECESNNGGCDSKRKCTNTAGSMKCEDCPAGYENAAKYVAKDKRQTSCSEGTPIKTVDDCKKAGPQFNGFKRVLSLGNYPTGCFLFVSTGDVFWNDKANGKANPSTSPVCYTGTKGCKGCVCVCVCVFVSLCR